MKQIITNTINYLNLISALILTAATIFSFSSFTYIVFWIFFISYFFELFLEKKWVGIHFTNKSIYFLIVLFFFLLAPFSSIFDDTPKYVKMLLERRYALLGFSIVGIFGINKKYKIKYFFQIIILSSIVAILYLIFYRVGINEFINDSARPVLSKLFNLNRIHFVNGHMMFNFYLNISLIGIWYLFSIYWKKSSWWKLFPLIPAFALFIYILSISEGRSGFTEACFLISGIIAIEIWKQKNKIIKIAMIILIPIVLFGLFAHHQRMSKLDLEKEPRIFLYKSALSEIKERPMFGYGLSNSQEEFDISRTKFQTDEYKLWALSLDQKIIDSHNQYLQTTMEFGIFGLVLLLIIYWYPILLVNKKRRLLALLIFALCTYHSIFDMFITGQFGTIFFILVILLLLTEDGLSDIKMKESLEE